MVSLNMRRYSLLLTTTLLLGALAIVSGRSVGSDIHENEEFELSAKTDVDEEMEEDGRSYSMSASTTASIESIFQQIMSLIKDQGSQEPNIIIIPIGGSSGGGSIGGGGGGSVGGGGGGGAGGNIPVSAIAEALVPEVVSAVVGNQASATRRRRRRKRPSNSGVRKGNKKRKPNSRRVFVIRAQDDE